MPEQLTSEAARPRLREPSASDDSWFNHGRMWVGRHSVDDDVLVFDPAVADPAAVLLSFYSLTHFRTRRFPRPVAERQIREIVDKEEKADVRRRYEQWPALKAAHEQEQLAVREEGLRRLRERTLQLHRQYLEAMEIAYQGTEAAASGAAKSRRSKCGACGIPLDGFVEAICVGCADLLCSCGACACGTRGRSRAKR